MEPEEELVEIVAQLREYLQFHELSGTVGLPRDKELKEKLLRSPLPDFSAQETKVGSGGAPSDLGASLSPKADAPSEQTPTWLGPPPSQGDPSNEPAPSAPFPQPMGENTVARSSNLIQLGRTLDEVRQRAASCQECDLHRERKQAVFSRGDGTSGLCFVGEGPGADEDAQGEPFVGAAGQLLDKMIHAMGFAREEVYVCNIVKCRPPKNRKPTPTEMQCCIGYLHRQLELVAPQVIVALGGTALEGLLGITQGITRTRGKFRLYQGRIAVMPTFHPAYLLRNPAAKRQVWTDLQQVVRHMGRETS